MSHFLTSGSTKTTEELKIIRANTISKWDSLGFLDGLSGHINPKIAELYECCKSTLLNETEENTENDIKGDS